MYNHQPEGYACPFCVFLRGEDNGVNHRDDIVYQDELATAFIAPRWWPRNEGYVLIIPNDHFENIYDLPSIYAHRIQDVAREIAIAFKAAYQCDGVSTRQHNEPAGNQDVWHYHMHVFPRYEGDNLYHAERAREYAPLEQRREYAMRPKAFLAQSIAYDGQSKL
ncbi:hydrolase [Ktedonobacter sp. SOSP1-85]|uniref:HIT family protein n=1 Tax=Ktedonobacter sp. SOSP1-85 TaxID=2778367 RepID=UPI0019159C5B|nr:HIT family protein [Ktedonobacter sp. SOSP1-85]GHO81671.1 hydrolase [Ktedonobacter sp. SOSP1-85]